MAQYALLPTDASAGETTRQSPPPTPPASARDVGTSARHPERDLLNHDDASKTHGTWLIHPTHRGFCRWNQVLLSTVLVEAVAFPLLLGLSSTFSELVVQVLTIVDIAAVVVFSVDMAIQPLVQIHNNDGTAWVRSHAVLFATYLSDSRLVIDVLCVFPFEYAFQKAVLFGLWERTDITLAIFGVVRFSRILRLVRLETMLGLASPSLHMSYIARTTLRAAVLVVMACHVFACYWSFLGLMSVSAEGDGRSWLVNYFGDSTGTGNIWAAKVYLVAMYFSMFTITSIGYGDVTPDHGDQVEIAATTGLMMLGGIIWAVVVASTVSVAQEIISQDSAFRQSMDDVHRIVALQGINPLLALRMKEYFEKWHELQGAKGTRKLVSQMSPDLQARVVEEVYADWLEDVNWLQPMSHACLVQVILQMANFLYIPREHIPDVRMVCFVIRGIAMHGGKLVRKGDSWGQDMILNSNSLRERFSGFAMSFVETVGIRRPHLDRVLHDFPEEQAMVRKFAVKLIVIRGLKMRAKEVMRMMKEHNLSPRTNAEGKQEFLKNFFSNITLRKYANKDEEWQELTMHKMNQLVAGIAEVDKNLGGMKMSFEMTSSEVTDEIKELTERVAAIVQAEEKRRQAMMPTAMAGNLGRAVGGAFDHTSKAFHQAVDGDGKGGIAGNVKNLAGGVMQRAGGVGRAVQNKFDSRSKRAVEEG